MVRHVGGICDDVDHFKPFILMDDGDLLAIISEMIEKRGFDNSMTGLVMIRRMTLLILDGGGLTHWLLMPLCNLSGACVAWYLVVL